MASVEPAARLYNQGMILRRIGLPLLLVLPLMGEIHKMTLRQAVERAIEQNPDLALARLDQRTATESVHIARDPFTPRIAVGSGLAYNNGFPLSIEGAAPSVFQAQANQFIYNRPQSYTVAKAKEQARGATIQAASKQDEVVYRVASAFLDAERTEKQLAVAKKQVESLETVARTVAGRVADGRELEIENKRARYTVARARQRVTMIESDIVQAQSKLAVGLGMDASDRVQPMEELRDAVALPQSEDQAVELALRASKDLRKIESDLMAEGLDIRAQKAARLPRVDLIAKYGLLARFNNYEDFFRSFQRHNYLLGMSFQIPVMVGPAVSALSSQSEINAAKLRVQRNSIRHQISLDVRKAWRDIKEAEGAGEVGKLDLEVAREQVSILLAQYTEGRASLKLIEEARFAENEKWIAYYEAQYGVERTRLNLLRQTGELMALVK